MVDWRVDNIITEIREVRETFMQTKLGKIHCIVNPWRTNWPKRYHNSATANLKLQGIGVLISLRLPRKRIQLIGGESGHGRCLMVAFFMDADVRFLFMFLVSCLMVV